MRKDRRELWVYLWQIRKDFCGRSRAAVAPHFSHRLKYDVSSSNVCGYCSHVGHAFVVVARPNGLPCQHTECKVREHRTVQYNTIQYNTIQYNTIQYNTIQYNTTQYNTRQSSAFSLFTCDCFLSPSV